MSHFATWVRRWETAGVPDDVIHKFYRLYGEPPEELTVEVVNDDGQAGIGPIRLGTSPEIRRHDWAMLLSKRGFPVETIAETQSIFLASMELSGVKHLYLAPRDVVFGIIGAVVGTGIMIVRELLQ